ncbi:hypothetical protein ACWC0C_07020 [Streptomyces sp. NPDC001709]
MTHSVSLGMFIAGAAYLAWRLGRWWAGTAPGKRNWKELIPLAVGVALSIVASACTGGLIGWAWHLGAQGQEQIGNATLTGVTGAHTATARTGAAFGVLDQWGATLLILAIAALIGGWKKIKKPALKDIQGGVWGGIGVGPLIGGYTLIPLVNSAGLHTIGHLFHAA